MCGICGLALRDTPVTRDVLERMTRRMEHRGPDEEGFFTDANIGLGHRRLKIIDLSTGQQPLFNEDGSVVVAFNGEIYNYRDIRTELEKSGHVFRTHSDTEVIVHAYEEYGANCVDHFRGMFAFAIYDRRDQTLFIARDRLGIKPVYYYQDDNRFAFASEVQPLLAGLGVRPDVNESALDFYLSVGYVPGEDTLFSGIRKLLPGHTLTLRKNRVEIRQYWDLPSTPALDISFADAKDRLDALIREAINIRLVSDVPLGAFLSGGVDSSVTVAYMSELMSEPVKTFSVGYRDDPRSSELQYARIVADHFKTDHHEFILESEDFFDSIDMLLRHTEEPIVESAAVALYRLSELAREHVTVILSGEGSDEILAGYPLHKIMPKVDRIQSPAGWLLRLGRPLLSPWLSEKSAKYLDWCSEPMASRYQSISNDVTQSIKSRMYAGPLREHANQSTRYFERLFSHLPQASNLRRMSYSDIKSWLPDDLLVKADKMTMAASLELRVPFLDHKLVEFATSLPDSYRLNGQEGKHLLKTLAAEKLPREIVYRKKQGFPVPIATWFRDALYERTRDVLLDPGSTGRGYFRDGYVEKILRRHREGKEDLSRRIFTLLALELWHRKYIDGNN